MPKRGSSLDLTITAPSSVSLTSNSPSLSYASVPDSLRSGYSFTRSFLLSFYFSHNLLSTSLSSLFVCFPEIVILRAGSVCLLYFKQMVELPMR